MALIRVFAFFLPQEQGGIKHFFISGGVLGFFGGVEGIGIARSMLVAHTDIMSQMCAVPAVGYGGRMRGTSVYATLS